MAEWTNKMDARLEQLWGRVPVLSTAAIGREIGVSKNSVVGRAHRKGLPSRPSPIKPGPDPKRGHRRAVPRPNGPTLPPLASTLAKPPSLIPLVKQEPRMKAPQVAKPPQPLSSQPAANPKGLLYTADYPHSCCAWLVSDGRPWMACGAARLPFQSYCAAHAQMSRTSHQRREADPPTPGTAFMFGRRTDGAGP